MKLVGMLTNRTYLMATDKRNLLRLANESFEYGAFSSKKGIRKVEYIYPEPMKLVPDKEELGDENTKAN